MSNLDHVRSYYEALNTGDVELVASHFTEEAVHYYTRLGPHRGREIAENAKWGVDNVDGQWWMEHGIESGDEVVIITTSRKEKYGVELDEVRALRVVADGK